MKNYLTQLHRAPENKFESLRTPTSSEAAAAQNKETVKVGRALTIKDAPKLRKVHQLEISLMKQNKAHFHNVQVANLDHARPALDTRKRNRMKSKSVLKKAKKYEKKIELETLKEEFLDFLTYQASLSGGHRTDMIDLNRMP